MDYEIKNSKIRVHGIRLESTSNNTDELIEMIAFARAANDAGVSEHIRAVKYTSNGCQVLPAWFDSWQTGDPLYQELVKIGRRTLHLAFERTAKKQQKEFVADVILISDHMMEGGVRSRWLRPIPEEVKQ